MAGEGEAGDGGDVAVGHGVAAGVDVAREDVLGRDRNGVAVVGGHDGQLGGLLVHGADAGLGEGDLVRLHDMESLTAQDGVATHELDRDVAQGIRHKGGAVQVALARVAHPEGRTLGDGCGLAGHAHAGGRDLLAGAHGQVVVLGGHNCVVELGGGPGGGDDHERGANGAGVSVGGVVDDGDLVSALLLGGEGGGAAAVQVCGLDAAGVDHYLGHLLGAAARGDRLLAAVEDHEHHATVRRDAHAGTRGPVAVVVASGGEGHLAVLHQVVVGAHGLHDVVLVGLVDGCIAHDGRAIVQDAEEALGAHRRVLRALHDQGTSGFAGRHVVEVRIDAHDRVIVRNVAVAGRIGVVGLGGSHLVGNALHAPGWTAGVILVVGLDRHIVAGHVGRGDVIDDLLVVRRGRGTDALAHAGRQGGVLLGEDGVVGVARGTGGDASLLAQVVRPGVAVGQA